MAMNSTEVSFECVKSQTRCVRPRRSNTGQHDGFKQSPQTFSRGNLSRSSTSVCKPARAQNAAQLDPAGPPPTIATSKLSIAHLIFVCHVERSRDISYCCCRRHERLLDFVRNDQRSLS